MTEKFSTLELTDFLTEIKDENNSLIKQLFFAQKCVKLFENYRKCLNSYKNNCNCFANNENKLLFNKLEKSYKSLVEEDLKNCGLTEDKIKISFNKKRKLSQTEDTSDPKVNNEIDFESELPEVYMNTNEDNDNEEEDSVCDNILFNKFEETLKPLEDNEYRLKYRKTNDLNNSIKYNCNWFKCGTSFKSESSLNQHMKSIHFEINSDYENITLKSKPESQILIKCGENININNNKSESSLELGFVCDWVGCDLRFRSEYELNRHQSSIHYCLKPLLKPRTNHSIGFGLKPLTIHSFETADKLFKCSQCEKSYTRVDRLRLHMKLDHNSGDYNFKIYRCDQCDYETRNSGHLKRHQMRRHTGEKPYKCDLDGCDPEVQCFATSDQLRSHQTNRHSDERPFVCDWPQCEASFKTRKHLTRHFSGHSLANSLIK